MENNNVIIAVLSALGGVIATILGAIGAFYGLLKKNNAKYKIDIIRAQSEAQLKLKEVELRLEEAKKNENTLAKENAKLLELNDKKQNLILNWLSENFLIYVKHNGVSQDIKDIIANSYNVLLDKLKEIKKDEQ